MIELSGCRKFGVAEKKECMERKRLGRPPAEPSGIGQRRG